MNNIARYQTLGWDFDETLWGHEKSKCFWDYIIENPHRQAHRIITFRTGRLLDRLWIDLADAQCPLLPLHFQGVHGVPEEIFRAFVGGLSGGERYVYWKGEVCRELGIECLIDDATMDVRPGCEMHEIVHYHPDIIDVETELRASVASGNVMPLNSGALIDHHPQPARSVMINKGKTRSATS